MNLVSLVSPTVEEQLLVWAVFCPCAMCCGVLSGYNQSVFATCPQILLYFLTIEIHRIY